MVIIGRNEGDRLKCCVNSLTSDSLKIVYVDSASSDDSVAFVRSAGFDVVELDMSIPFSAARARNEGYRYLLNRYPNIEYIQFVDGDCEIDSDWISTAHEYLVSHAELAAVCGRRVERFPEKTIYNQLCDIEWNTPVGPARATGGDFMCRAQALLDVDGFSPQVIAGEEPEMCLRMRQKGWKIERLGHNMTLHDANMTHFSQWWKRNERSGHAYTQGFFMHGRRPDFFCRTDVLRILLWALVVPLLVLLALFIVGPMALLLLMVYPLKIGQVFIRELGQREWKIALAYSSSLVLGKFPQCKGCFVFLKKHLLGKDFQIIEYKG